MSVLPHTVALSRHRRVYRRGPDARQIGLDPATAVVADDLVPALAAMLDELDGPADPGSGAGRRVDTTGLLARAVDRGAPLRTAERLLAELIEAGSLVDAASAALGTGHRASTTVVVEGEGPLAVGLTLGLARSGVAVGVVTGGTVRAADLGTGLVDTDVGRARSAAVVDAVHRLVPDGRVGTPPPRPDLVVLADAVVPDPLRATALLADRVPHLPVWLRDGTGVVGPLVLPRRTACLRCVELHRGARDPCRHLVAAQLATRAGSADPACTVATAALGTAQALLALTQGRSGAPPTLSGTLELDTAAGTIRRHPCPPHRDCGCGAAPSETDHGRTCAVPPARETIER